MAANLTGQTCPCLKYRFIRGLIDLERHQRKKHWMKQAAEWTSKAIVSLDLTPHLIKSIAQAKQLDGIGTVVSKQLAEFRDERIFSLDPPAAGMCASSASALMVALLILSESGYYEDILDGQTALVPERCLYKAAIKICEERFVGLAEAGKADKVFCQARWRLTVLASQGLVKKRMRDKQVVYQLLLPGKEIAKRLRESRGLSDVMACHLLDGMLLTDTAKASGTKKKQKRAAPAEAAQKQHLYTNDDGSDGLVLYVDTQEWGGDRVGLGSLCRQLNEAKVCYATCKLKTGDYCWIWKLSGQQMELPVLVERKRADDLAGSIVDGRFKRQQKKMLEWKEKYTKIGMETTLTYIIEGHAADYVVRCADGCGGVGRCGYPNEAQVKAKIEELDASPDFNLVQTENIMATVQVLVAMTTELNHRLQRGDFFRLVAHREELTGCSKNSGARKKRAKTEHATCVGEKTNAAPTNYSSYGSNNRKWSHDTSDTWHPFIGQEMNELKNLKTDEFDIKPHLPENDSKSIRTQSQTNKARRGAGDAETPVSSFPDVISVDSSDDEKCVPVIGWGNHCKGNTSLDNFDSGDELPDLDLNTRDRNEQSLDSTSYKCQGGSILVSASSALKAETKAKNSDVVSLNFSKDYCMQPDKVAMVTAILPHVSEDVILSALQSAGGDVEMAISSLLD